MAVIIDIDHEVGDFSEYTGVTGDTSDLVISSAAALAGTSQGLAVVCDDQNSMSAYVLLGSANTSGVIRCRVYLDPNSITMNASSEHSTLWFGNSSNGQVGGWSFGRNDAGTSYKIYGTIGIDSGGHFQGSTVEISDAPHFIEILIKRATGGSTNDGILRLWVDGSQVYERTNIDNYTVFGNLLSMLIGATANVDAGTLGTYYLDQIIVRDDDTEIGAHVGPVTINLDAAALTASGQALDIVPGAASVTLDAAALLATGKALDPAPGPVSIALDAAAVIAAGLSVSVVPGAVSVGLDAASINAQGQAIDPAPGAVAVTLAAAAVVAQGQALTVTLIDNITVSLDAAGLSAAGLVLGVVPGAVSISLDTALAAATGLPVTLDAGTPDGVLVNLGAASVTASGQSLAAVPGAVTIALDAAAIAVSAPAAGIVPGAVIIAIQPGAVTAAGQVLGLAPGAVSVGLSAAAITAVPWVFTVSAAPHVTVIIAHLTLRARGLDLTVNERSQAIAIRQRSTSITVEDR
jgi:hypothetical protein